MSQPESPSSSSSSRDYGFYVIVSMVCVVVIWLVLTPLVSAVAMSTIKRFHLRSDSFVNWACQFPIPAMYNFANECKVSDTPPGLIDSFVETNEARYINHFPIRLFTFADARNRYLGDGQHKWLEVTSRYRGQTLTTTIHANPGEQGNYELIRLPIEGPAKRDAGEHSW